MKFLQCFRRPLSTGNSNPNPDPEAPLLPGYQPSCVFCDVSVKKGFAIEYEDDELIVFRDRWPRAREHLLVIPRAHVGTVRGLTPADIPLIECMAARARALRPESTSPNTKLGFHIPPFSSVAHLHLHVLVPPFTKFGSVQYPVREREDGGKKWTWFVTPEQVVAILGNGSGEGIGLGSAPGKRT